jgi:hypothetical protein
MVLSRDYCDLFLKNYQSRDVLVLPRFPQVGLTPMMVMIKGLALERFHPVIPFTDGSRITTLRLYAKTFGMELLTRQKSYLHRQKFKFRLSH